MSDILNPKLFNSDDQQLKPEIREAMLDIVEEFLSNSETADFEINVLDVRLVGSNAAYNYTEYSDLDIHIVVNMEEICKEHPEVLKGLFQSEKLRFNKDYDISIKDIETEIYVEDIRTMTSSNGIYSIMYDRWIKFPEELPENKIPDDIDENEQYVEILNDVKDTIQKGSSTDIQDTLNAVYMLRKESIEAEGESGLGNLIFKQLRNEGYLDELRQKYYEVRSAELTVENIQLRKTNK